MALKRPFIKLTPGNRKIGAFLDIFAVQNTIIYLTSRAMAITILKKSTLSVPKSNRSIEKLILFNASVSQAALKL